MVVNKAIHDTFQFSKIKIVSKSYEFKINGIAVCNKAIHDTF